MARAGRRGIRTLLAVFAGLAVAGCFLAGSGGQDSARVLLRVQNELETDVQMTAIRSGGEVWRDQVRAYEERVIEVRSGDLSHATVQFLLEPRGTNDSYVTTGVAIQPGDVVVLHIARLLSQSSVMLQ